MREAFKPPILAPVSNYGFEKGAAYSNRGKCRQRSGYHHTDFWWLLMELCEMLQLNASGRVHVLWVSWISCPPSLKLLIYICQI